MGCLLSLTFTCKTVGATERSSGTVTGQKTDSACSPDIELEGLRVDTAGGGLEEAERASWGCGRGEGETSAGEDWDQNHRTVDEWFEGVTERKELRLLPSSRWVTGEIK